MDNAWKNFMKKEDVKEEIREVEAPLQVVKKKKRRGGKPLDWEALARDYLNGEHKTISGFFKARKMPSGGLYFKKLKKTIEDLGLENKPRTRGRPKQQVVKKQQEDNDFLERWFSVHDNLSKEEYAMIKKVMGIIQN